MKSIYKTLLLLALLLIMATPAFANSNIASNIAEDFRGNLAENIAEDFIGNTPENTRVNIAENTPVNAAVKEEEKVGQASGVSILLDGQVVNTNPTSYIDSESAQTLVPIRFVSESLNAKVKWEAKAKKITVIQGKKTIVMNIDSRDVYIDGSKKKLAKGVSPKLVNESTMVPLRFLSEAFGYEVGFDQEKTMPKIVTQKEIQEEKEAKEAKEVREEQVKQQEEKEIIAKPVPAALPSSVVHKITNIPLGNALSEKVMAESLKYEGTPYVSGGSCPDSGFDCSGLVQWNYKKAGVILPRTAKEQWAATVEVASDKAQPGDLVFFKGTYGGEDHISHVGIYIDESRMYNSNNSGVGYSTWSNGYWKKHFDSIRRIK